MNLLDTLKQYWGYTAFRPPQEDIVRAVLDGKDVVALLPTGAGKSLCFQMPTMVRAGTCIVVSPLIALMKDQVLQLKSRGIAAEAIFSGMAVRDVDRILDNCVYGAVKFLYVSPERLKTDILRVRVQKMVVSLLAIDEAHCISAWGYDFRPSYAEIAAFREILPTAVNAIALTATATPEVEADICQKLALRKSQTFRTSFRRDNLAYRVLQVEGKAQQLLQILRRSSGSAIVYVRTRRRASATAHFLAARGMQATFYHAGLSAQERDLRQKAWTDSDVRVMVATNAFGMGIDKANVRLVIHVDLPLTLEAYYQETGRAGRDGKRACAIALYDMQDLADLRDTVAKSLVSADFLKKVYQCLANYYEVAVGSHAGVTYPLQVEAFAERYRMGLSQAYRGLQHLERFGLIQLVDNQEQSSTVHLMVSPKEIYRIQVANTQYNICIKTLLRLYGGELFTDALPISEKNMAAHVGVKERDMVQTLKYLDGIGTLRYTPGQQSMQVVFLTPRCPAAHIPIDHKQLKSRAKLATQKAEQVIAYITHRHRCRMQLLVEYFGEVSYKKCQDCDICAAQQNTHALTDQDQRSVILNKLRTGPTDVHTWLGDAEEHQRAVLLTRIREMLDRGELLYVQPGILAMAEDEKSS